MRYQQPQSGAQIDWNNPLLRDVAAIISFSSGVPFEHTTKQFFSLFPTATRTRVVRDYYGSSNTAYPSPTGLFKLTNPTKADSIAGAGVPISIFSEFTTNGGEFGSIVCSTESSNGWGFNFVCDDYTYNLNSLAFGYNSGNYTSAGNNAIGTSCALTAHRSAVTYDGTNRKFFNSGNLVSNSTYTFSPTTSANRRLALGGNDLGQRSSVGTGLIIIWSRCVPDAEVKTLSANPWQIFKSQPNVSLLFSQVVGAQPQLLSPSSDISTGAWTSSLGGSLYAAVDESVASDSDYITANSATSCEMKLAAGIDPAVSTGHILRYRLLAGSGSVTVSLKQGATTIASWGPHALTGAAQDFAQTLTGAQADSITDYTDLRVVFTSS